MAKSGENTALFDILLNRDIILMYSNRYFKRIYQYIGDDAMNDENNEELEQNLEENTLEDVIEEELTESIQIEENEIVNKNDNKQKIIKLPEIECFKKYPLIIWGILINTLSCLYLACWNNLNNFIAIAILGSAIIIFGFIVLLLEKIDENVKTQKENDNKEKGIILESILNIADDKLRVEIIKELIITDKEKK